jgi:polar amino acid transport system substrate-binding protein
VQIWRQSPSAKVRLVPDPKGEDAPMRSRLTAVIAAIAFAAVTVAAGCGSSNDNGTSSQANLTATPGINVPKDPKIASEVPQAIAQTGELTIATDATYPPNEFLAKDGHTIIGADADLGKAIGQVMGLTPRFSNVTFDAIIPALQANKYDAGISSFTDTKEREKVVDFVTYERYGTLFYTNADGPTITSLDQLCGHTATAETGTTQADDIASQNKTCTASGKPGVKSVILESQNDVNLPLSSGRADVGMADSPVVKYIVDTSGGKFKLAGQPYGAAPYGIAIPKGTGMTTPVLDAIKAIQADGTYDKILSYWQLSSGHLTNPGINQGIAG